MRARQLVGLGERDVGAEQRLDAHRCDDAGGPNEAVRVGIQERADCGHQLGAVEQRETLLRAKDDRFQSPPPAARAAPGAGDRRGEPRPDR